MNFGTRFPRRSATFLAQLTKRLSPAGWTKNSTSMTAPSWNDVALMLAVNFSFDFCQSFVPEVREANNGPDQAEEDGEL